MVKDDHDAGSGSSGGRQQWQWWKTTAAAAGQRRKLDKLWDHLTTMKRGEMMVCCSHITNHNILLGMPTKVATSTGN
jgi:hypothetical protein